MSNSGMHASSKAPYRFDQLKRNSVFFKAVNITCLCSRNSFPIRLSFDCSLISAKQNCELWLDFLTWTFVEMSYIKILGSESFTRWLVWGASTRDSTSAQELRKIRNCLHPHHLWVHKVQFFLLSSSVWVSPPPNIVSTTEAAFLFMQNDNL